MLKKYLNRINNYNFKLNFNLLNFNRNLFSLKNHQFENNSITLKVL